MIEEYFVASIRFDRPNKDSQRSVILVVAGGPRRRVIDFPVVIQFYFVRFTHLHFLVVSSAVAHIIDRARIRLIGMLWSEESNSSRGAVADEFHFDCEPCLDWRVLGRRVTRCGLWLVALRHNFKLGLGFLMRCAQLLKMIVGQDHTHLAVTLPIFDVDPIGIPTCIFD